LSVWDVGQQQVVQQFGKDKNQKEALA